MSKQFTDHRVVGNVVVVTLLDARIMDVTAIKAAGKELLAYVEQDPCSVIVNFSRVQFVSSEMLDELLKLHKALMVDRADCMLLFCDVQHRPFQMFTLARMPFLIESDENAALEKLGQPV